MILMSVLVDWELNELIKDGTIGIMPLGKGAIQSNSIDVRLGNNFACYDVNYAGVEIDPYDEDSTRLGLIAQTTDRILLIKGAFLLAETMETIKLPDNICATIEGKSSMARLGITVHQTGGWIDCGFEGTITMEMTNENIRPIVLTAGMPIAQIVFYKTETAQLPYHARVSAKYNKQSGATGSRFYKNKR
jgi:dCTP deaminase